MSATTYLTISGVNKRFGGLQALRDCSFSIGPGKIICLVGPNGAGKTTVFNAITGFLKADSGEVGFKEHRLTGKRPQAIVRLGVARTFQNLRLFTDLTALDNVVSALPDQFGEEPIGATFRPSARAGRRRRCATGPRRSFPMSGFRRARTISSATSPMENKNCSP
jgi:branched-chain amino acid transport system ATP-binding protein